MRKITLTLLTIAFVQLLSAQHPIKGFVIDKATKEPLIGVSIYNPGSGTGASTSFDGSFSLKVPAGEQKLTVSYVGYTTETISVNAKTSNNITVELNSEAIGLNDVVVTSSVAIRRKTPVALSIIEPAQIEMKLGTQEFPEILKSTPGVYATKTGGGYGDSRINLRGFSSENIAVMINGVPMNDMEWGGVYWSNWAGLSDVTRSLQVQRGLGASKVAAPSVGGSINIVTKSTEAKKGGSLFYGIGHNGQNKMSFSVSTGLKNGWAMTLLGARNTGQGFIQGTDFEGYSYFLNVSKIVNDNHQLSFTGFGAPQWHYQRRDQLRISEWAKYGQRYNPSYGYDINGQRRTFNFNYYHKPQLSLNHLWTIDHKSSLSTALYVSIGNGGGYGALGANRTDAFGSTGGIVNTKYRKIDGTFDYGKLQQENAASETGSLIALQESINNHYWYGLLSTYTTTLFDKFDFQGGIDVRYYQGIHQSKVVDLLGGKFVIDPARVNAKFRNNPQWVNERLYPGDISFRDYDGFVAQEGVFGQIEYNQGNLNTFVAGAVNNSTYWRVDRFYQDNVRSDIANKLGYSIKGGANYNIDKFQNVFANIGHFSRTPFFSGGIFLQTTTSNALNLNARNEKVFSSELGYGFRSKMFAANLNLYFTQWNDKSMIRSIDSTDPERGTINMAGVNALHQGIELDFNFRPIRNLEITGMLSLGDWEWKNNATGYLYNRDGQAVNSRGDQVELMGPDHTFVTLNLDGIKVGNSAQTSTNIGVNYKFLDGFKFGLDYTYHARNYSNFNVIINNWGVNKFEQPWMIPAAGVFDLFANYQFKIGEHRATVFGNVSNLLNVSYIADGQTGGTNTWETAQVYYGFGRVWSMGLKVSFN